jgi:hypothetical protein
VVTNRVRRDDLPHARVRFLQKPFDCEALLRIIETLEEVL